MRLVTYEKDRTEAVGVRTEAGIVPTGYASMLDLIADGARGLDKARAAAASAPPVRGARLLAPVLRPSKVICTGVNYASHKEENPNAVFPETPFFFAKLPSAIVGPDETIVLPAPHSQVDYEAELAFVIGRAARGVKREQALDFIFGYTVANDVSARDVQFKDNQMTLGKGFDTFCPLGPELVTSDDIPDPAALRVEAYVNGELRQSAGTSEMLFDIPTLLEALTAHITLLPGDVVTTGTPAGVGTFRTPPLFLRPGDEVVVKVDRIGELRNSVAAGWQ